jgi:hypothetical protein
MLWGRCAVWLATLSVWRTAPLVVAAVGRRRGAVALVAPLLLRRVARLWGMRTVAALLRRVGWLGRSGLVVSMVLGRRVVSGSALVAVVTLVVGWLPLLGVLRLHEGLAALSYRYRIYH